MNICWFLIFSLAHGFYHLFCWALSYTQHESPLIPYCCVYRSERRKGKSGIGLAVFFVDQVHSARIDRRLVKE